MGLFGKKPVGTDIVAVLGSGLGMGAAQGLANAIGSGPSQAALTAQQMAQQQALQNVYNLHLAGAYGSHTHTVSTSTYPMPAPRYLSYNINVSETSNGYVITLDEIVRVCSTTENKDDLIREIAAAIGEYMLSIKEGER